MDVKANPSGDINVLDRQPDVATKLIDNHLQWRETVRSEELFQGTLSRPLIINERVVPDEEGQAIGNGISGVPSTCPADQAG